MCDMGCQFYPCISLIYSPKPEPFKPPALVPIKTRQRRCPRFPASLMALTKAVEPESGRKVRMRTSESTGRVNTLTVGDEAMKLRKTPAVPTWKPDEVRAGTNG
jgi:hypothetical protein